jgi:hypothetical protein
MFGIKDESVDEDDVIEIMGEWFWIMSGESEDVEINSTILDIFVEVDGIC